MYGVSSSTLFVPVWNGISRCEGRWGALCTLGQGSGGDGWGVSRLSFGVVKRRTGGEEKKGGEADGGMYGIQPYGTTRYGTIEGTHRYYTTNQV